MLSLFSGIGAFEKALEKIEEPFEVVRYCEIDKYASKAYSLIHNIDENMNLKDICSVETDDLPKDIDMITYGFPCQDISQCGKQKGFTNKDGTLTRSGLFFEALRIIEDTRPKIAICENVKALVGKRFTIEFKIVLDSLRDAGYRNYWSVLNSKDYGIPQNRERVFIISIRDDIDHGFQFPKKRELKLRLRDLLEETVDEKYYLSDKMLDVILSSGTKNFHYKPEIDLEIARPLVTTMHKMHRAGTDNYVSESFVQNDEKMEIEDCLKIREVTRLFNIYGHTGGNYAGNVFDKDGISPAILAAQGGNRQPMIIDDFLPVKEATKKGYAEAHEGDFVNLQQLKSETRRGRVGEQIAQTLCCNEMNGVVMKEGEMRSLRIRKLTPKECFRLMGFDDRDCDILIENKISNTQLYKMAGNSIVVDVLEEIFVELLNQYEDVFPLE